MSSHVQMAHTILEQALLQKIPAFGVQMKTVPCHSTAKNFTKTLHYRQYIVPTGTHAYRHPCATLPSRHTAHQPATLPYRHTAHQPATMCNPVLQAYGLSACNHVQPCPPGIRLISLQPCATLPSRHMAHQPATMCNATLCNTLQLICTCINSHHPIQSNPIQHLHTS